MRIDIEKKLLGGGEKLPASDNVGGSALYAVAAGRISQAAWYQNLRPYLRRKWRLSRPLSAGRGSNAARAIRQSSNTAVEAAAAALSPFL